MNHRDDARRLRDRQDGYDAALAAVPALPPDGSPRTVARTIDGGAYPMEVGVFLAVEAVSLTGEEREGGVVTVTPTNTTFYAYSAGTTPPVPGALVECVWVPYRWVTICEGNGGGRANVLTAAADPCCQANEHRLQHLDADGNTTSAVFKALNNGTVAPSIDTVVDYWWATDHWAFRYDG